MVATEGPVVHVRVRVLVLVGRSTQLLVHQRPRGGAPLLLALPPPLPDDLVRHEGGGHCSVDMSDSSDREEHVGGDDHDRRRSRRWPRRELVRRGRQRLGNGFSHRRELGLATRVQAQDPAACYLVTARTEVSKTAPYRLHTAYLILEKSKSECFPYVCCTENSATRTDGPWLLELARIYSVHTDRAFAATAHATAIGKNGPFTRYRLHS